MLDCYLPNDLGTMSERDLHFALAHEADYSPAVYLELCLEAARREQLASQAIVADEEAA